MRKRQLGKTGQLLSVIGFGAIVFVDENQKFAQDSVAQAIDKGINYFDMGPGYGKGQAEEIGGPAIKPYRDKIFLAEKTGKRTKNEALKELKQSRGLGVDVSPGAIKIAQMNSQNLNLNARSKFKVIDFKDFNIGKYDLIVSNPPYIALKDIKNLARDIIRYEPLVALRGGFDGLEIIRKVIYKSKYLIKENGLLAIEIGTNQYIKVSEILKKNGFREINNECDFNKNVRCIISTYT